MQGPTSTFPRSRQKVGVVLVDITVLKGKDPVTDLAKEDFQVFENGQPQTILSFEEHKGAALTMVKRPPMPADEFTNVPTVGTTDSVNVILLDALNTQNADQMFVRSQMIQYLKELKPGPRLAIFTLGSRLRMLQGFIGRTKRHERTANLAIAQEQRRKGGRAEHARFYGCFRRHTGSH